MTITLRQESQAGTTTKGSSLTYAELDNNFIDILTNKILPLQVNADTGVVTVGQAQSNGVFTITGGTGVSTTVTEDSAGNATLTINNDFDTQLTAGTGISISQPDSGSGWTVAATNAVSNGTTTSIYAKCSGAISVGDVVMFAGVQGDHLLVKKAVIDDSAGAFVAEYIVGIAPDDFANNDFGYFVTQGQVTHANLNTNSYAPGTILWYDPTTSGGWTATEPSAPNPKVRVAAVLKQNATDGILLVRPTFSRRITDAEDVDTAAAVNNDYLVYNSATGVWQHQALDISTDTTPQLGGTLNANSNNFTNVGTINTHTIPGGTGTLALTSDIPSAGDSVQAGDNIEITSPDSAGGKTIAFRNPLNQPVVGGDQTFRQINLEDYSETIYTGGSTTGTITPDVANGNVQRITLTGSITLNALGNPAAGQSLTLIVQQPASGGPYTLSSTMKFAGGTKTLSTGASEWDIITVFYDGTNYFASLSTNFS